jgi:hypothetical protein
MTQKLAPFTTSVPDWAHYDRVGGAAPTSAVAGGGREPFMTVAEAAALLRVSEKTIRRLIASGQIGAVRILVAPAASSNTH